MAKRQTRVSDDGSEWVVLEVRIEKVFDGSAMNYSVESASTVKPEFLSEKFKKVLREDWDIDVDEHTALVATEETVIDLDEERIIFE